MKRKTFKEWDEPIYAGFPVGLYVHPSGENRLQRRAAREHKHDTTSPSSMVPAVKRIKDGKEKYVAAR